MFKDIFCHRNMATAFPLNELIDEHLYCLTFYDYFQLKMLAEDVWVCLCVCCPIFFSFEETHCVGQTGFEFMILSLRIFFQYWKYRNVSSFLYIHVCVCGYVYICVGKHAHTCLFMCVCIFRAHCVYTVNLISVSTCMWMYMNIDMNPKVNIVCLSPSFSTLFFVISSPIESSTHQFS